MASKLQYIYELSENVSRNLSGYENWTARALSWTDEKCQLGGMNKAYAYPTGTAQTQIPHSFYLGRTLQNELTSFWTWADLLRKIRFYK